MQKYKKIWWLDCIFATDVVGNGDDDVMGPFEVDKHQFYKSQVIPLFDGWIGEIMRNFWKLSPFFPILQHLLMMGYPSTHYWILIWKKGNSLSSSNILGEQSVWLRGHVVHKMSRSHYVQETVEETANVERTHHSDNCNDSWACKNYAWNEKFMPMGYNTFQLPTVL